MLVLPVYKFIQLAISCKQLRNDITVRARQHLYTIVLCTVTFQPKHFRSKSTPSMRYQIIYDVVDPHSFIPTPLPSALLLAATEKSPGIWTQLAYLSNSCRLGDGIGWKLYLPYCKQRKAGRGLGMSLTPWQKFNIYNTVKTNLRDW